MTTQEIANRLSEHCSQGEWEAAQRELFADDAVSIEPHATPGFDKETRGLDAIIEKGKRFNEMVEQVHGIKTSEPLVAGNAIAMTLSMDVTMKGQGQMNIQELCVYNVKDGKIISEQFYI